MGTIEQLLREEAFEDSLTFIFISVQVQLLQGWTEFNESAARRCACNGSK
jgi:hypothetical protein